MLRDFGTTEAYMILAGFGVTIQLSLLALVVGMIGGACVAALRTAPYRLLRGAAQLYIELFQGTPLLMQLFVVFFGLTYAGFHVSTLGAMVVGLGLHASAFLGEIWGGAVEAVPAGQRDAARSLGLGYSRMMYLVIVPQAAPIALPPTAGFLVQLIKGTSVAAIVGFVELTRAGQLVTNVTFKPFTTFACVAILYFVLCWPISKLSQRLESRYGRHRG